MKKGSKWLYIPLTLVALLVWWPLWFMLMGAMMSPEELRDTFGPAINATAGQAHWSILPTWPTPAPLAELLLDTPEFLTTFWNTCMMVLPQVLGQFLIATPAAWAFSRLRFRGRKTLFTLYIVLMLMPFQVMMAPNYLVLDSLGLMDTVWAVILPGIFSAFPVFIMSKSFDAIPWEIQDAANLDGANQWQIFWQVGMPLGRPGILAALVLTVLESWSAIEQPMTFLRDEQFWPLSLVIPNVLGADVAYAMGASFVALVPAIVIFRFGQKYLELGIQSSGLVQ
ncbi:MAG: carbohydrate ABC transporter permease [Ruminiclostridium sp.]|nr:carbohydrate ABC transporter permease [Ruminiclostridium sp.]